MNNKVYKYCSVPLCKSTSITTPEKLFIYVPNNKEMRTKWFNLARRDSFYVTSSFYFCEDHFDLQRDMENYIKYRTMGKVSQIRMIPGCVPSKFVCQPDRILHHSVATNRKRQSLSEKCELEKKSAIVPHINNSFNIDDQSTIPDKHQQSEKVKIDEVIPSHKKQNSPLKISIASSSTSSCNMSQNVTLRVRDSFKRYDKSDSDDSTCTASECFSSAPSECSDHSKDETFDKGEIDNFTDLDLEKEVNSRLTLKITVNKIENKPEFYIGLPKNCYFLIKIINKHTAIPEQHILLCLKKIRLDSMFAELGNEFAITGSNARKIFMTNIPRIAQVLQPFIIKLDKIAIKRCLPKAFTKKYFNITCIIDCLEIEIQKPTNAINQFLTWSEYKKAYTLKYLISSTPNGLINYVSQGYGGSISDVCLVEYCGFLSCLPSDSHVMADRRFEDIKPLLLQVGCQLIQASSIYLDSKSSQKVKETKKIATMRILIEVAIQRLKQFIMLTPYSCVKKRLIGKLDNVVVIASGLINLQNSLCK